MIYFFKTFSWLCVLFFLLSNLKPNEQSLKTISHNVVINHPGEKEPVKTILKEIQNGEGLPVEYTMDVYSVICLDEVCKIIPVKLYWNNIGVYLKYELPKGETLEKYEADLFEPQDYIKLQSILSDNNSPFKEVYIDEILTVPDEHGNEDVDAVSGATALELDEKDTVAGAALTCFTLWHWANGDVVSEIKNQTGISASNEQLKDFILDENNTYFYIALKALKERNLFTKPVLNTIVEKALKNDTVLRSTFKHLKEAPPELYFYACERLFFEGGKEQKLAGIQSLREINYKIPDGYLDKFSSELSELNSYQEISLLLGLMESKNPNSQIVTERTMHLLDGDFLIARRAYWFLKNKELSVDQIKLLYIFYEKNKNRL